MRSEHIRADFSAAAIQYDCVATLQRYVATRLMELLPSLSPKTQILDIGAGTGFLAESTTSGEWWLLDLSTTMLQQAQAKNIPHVCGMVVANAEHLPIARQSMDIVVSSLAFQWIQDPTALLTQVHACLKPEGMVAFATFAPRTLQELRASFHHADPEHARVHDFIAPESWDAALQASGFESVCFESEVIIEHYPTPHALVAQLRTIGATHKDAGRSRSFTGQERFARAMDFYAEHFQSPEGVVTSWEVGWWVAKKMG
jgi:malonyl-CoA O-methyltransferase